MPEGDTVYRAARSLDETLAGHRLTRCDIRVPAHATVDLSGERVDEVVSRGKQVLMRIGETTIHSHLKMEGAWHVYAHGARWRRPAWQARIIIATAEHVAVGFELGLVEVIDRASEHDAVGHLGPDLLGSDWDADAALAHLLRRPERAVGMALLDQRNLAGIGNIYMNELCYVRGILPSRPIGETAEPQKLVALAKRMLEANKERSTRTTTGRLRGDTTWVYGRAGSPCLRCGTLIERGPLGGAGENERVSFWCPVCQR